MFVWRGGGSPRSVSRGLRPDVGTRKIFYRKFMLMSQPGTHPGAAMGSRASRYCRTAGTTHVEIYGDALRPVGTMLKTCGAMAGDVEWSVAERFRTGATSTIAHGLRMAQLILF